ncbi:hypothetical protein ACFX19_047288 [Malus domestica]
MKISLSGTTFIPVTKSKSGWKMVNFSHEAGGCLKLPDVDLSSTVVQWDQGWLGFAPGMMGYKAQVVASAIALPICGKNKKGWPEHRENRQLSWPQTATYRG